MVPRERKTERRNIPALHRMVLLSWMALGWVPVTDAQTQIGTGSSLPSFATVPACQVFLIDDVRIPARQAGVLVELSVRQGSRVRAGGIVARIDDRMAQYEKLTAELKRDVTLARAENDIDVRYSQASYGVADAELAQSQDIDRRVPGSVSDSELRRLRLTRQRALLQIERSQLDLHAAKLTADVEQAAVAAAEDRISRRRILVPFDGPVLEVFKHRAEWVNEGEPVVRLIRLNRLRVEGFLSARQFNPDEIDRRSVMIEIERARGQKVRLRGAVVFVSPMLQAGNKYRVTAEVDNRRVNDQWVLKPGMTATMTVELNDSVELSARPEQ